MVMGHFQDFSIFPSKFQGQIYCTIAMGYSQCYVVILILDGRPILLIILSTNVCLDLHQRNWH